MKRFIAGLTIISLFSPTLSLAQDDFEFNPNYLLSDAEMTDSSTMTVEQIDAFLKRGALSGALFETVTGSQATAAQIIYDAATEFELNPQFLLVLLQREQSLVEDDSPTQRQLDWAMGYGVCDDCSKEDPRIQKFKGFGNQIYYAAERIRTNYLVDLERRGFTETGLGPDRTATIDNTYVVPANFATASLYTYTPHLHGNENFARIWQKWFASQYLNGTVVQDQDSGGIWLIQDELRRPITSRAAFHSRFNPNNLIQVSATTLERYPIGASISFPNYSLLRAPTGTVFLLVDDTRRGFASRDALRQIGFSPDEIVDVSWNDLEPYREGPPITVETTYAQGTLLQDLETGGVFYVEDSVKRPIHSREILDNRFANLAIEKDLNGELTTLTRGADIGFLDGTLVAAHGSPDIFVIENGLRRHIKDEGTFLSYGWQWNQIIWTNERSVLLHPLGDEFASDTITDVVIARY